MSETEVSKDLCAVVFGNEGKCGLNVVSQQNFVIPVSQREEFVSAVAGGLLKQLNRCETGNGELGNGESEAEAEQVEDLDGINGGVEAVIEERCDGMLKLELQFRDLESVKVNDASGNENGECDAPIEICSVEDLDIGRGFRYGNSPGIEGVAERGKFDDLLKSKSQFGDLESVEVNGISGNGNGGCEVDNRNGEFDARIERCSVQNLETREGFRSRTRLGMEGVAKGLIGSAMEFGDLEINRISGNVNDRSVVENRKEECNAENLESGQGFQVGIVDLVENLESVEKGEINYTSGGESKVEKTGGGRDAPIKICSVENLERGRGFEVGVVDLIEDLESNENGEVNGTSGGECKVEKINGECDAPIKICSVENLERGQGFEIGTAGLVEDLESNENGVNNIAGGECMVEKPNGECDAPIKICSVEKLERGQGFEIGTVGLVMDSESVENGEVDSTSGGECKVEERNCECDVRIKIRSADNLEKGQGLEVGFVDLIEDLESCENGEVHNISACECKVERTNGECDARFKTCSTENLETGQRFELEGVDLVGHLESVGNGEVNNTSDNVNDGCEVENKNGECDAQIKTCSAENFESGQGFQVGIVDLAEDLSLVADDKVSLTREVADTAKQEVSQSSLELDTMMEELPKEDVKSYLSVDENENHQCDTEQGQKDESKTVVSSIDCQVETVRDLVVHDECVTSHFCNGIQHPEEPPKHLEDSETFLPSDDHLSDCGREIIQNGSAYYNSCSHFAPLKARSESAKDGVVTENELTVENAVSIEQTSTLGLKSEPEPRAHNIALNTVVSKEATSKATRKPFNFLVRIPRFEDDNLKEQIKLAKLSVDEKTQHRDAIQVQIQEIRANNQIHGVDYELAKAEGRNARKLVRSKRMEIDALQAVINRAKNALSIEDIDMQIYNIERMMQHETLQLKEEKQVVREIKRLKQLREQLSSNMGSQDEVNQALEKREEVEARLKTLRKELDYLKDRVLKAEAAAVEAEIKYDGENKRVKELQARFKAANDVRQSAYAQLQTLRKELANKNKHFFMYKDAAAVANNCVFSGDTETLYSLCMQNVENFIELWNTNDEFREDYVRFNERSTVRRFGTQDGRSLGPDELSSMSRTISDPLRVDVALPTPNLEDENQKAVHEKPATPVLENKYIDDEVHEEPMKSREEIELIKKVEETRRKEDEAKLKEQRRLEALAKASEARERKKRQAEKLQVRAELKILKEAEQKEKEREKRLRKKERKKAAFDVNETNQDSETPASSESSAEISKDLDMKKATQKSWSFAKHGKSKSLPAALRNRNKKKLQQWMWVSIASFIFVALFWILNIGVISNLRRRNPMH